MGNEATPTSAVQGNYLWAGKIKAIEGQHGSGVGSYFRFLRLEFALEALHHFYTEQRAFDNYFQVSLQAQRGAGPCQLLFSVRASNIGQILREREPDQRRGSLRRKLFFRGHFHRRGT